MIYYTFMYIAAQSTHIHQRKYINFNLNDRLKATEMEFYTKQKIN